MKSAHDDGMKKSNREAIANAIATYLHFKQQETNLRAALEARIGPIRALYEESVRKAEEAFATELKESAQKIADSAAAVERILNEEKMNSVVARTGTARLDQATQLWIDPEAFLRVAGHRADAFHCMGVEVGKARKYLSADALASVSENRPKGKPKLVIESNE
jgi:hypothetical protein